VKILLRKFSSGLEREKENGTQQNDETWLLINRGQRRIILENFEISINQNLKN
jgi:hypothetical protein